MKACAVFERGPTEAVTFRPIARETLIESLLAWGYRMGLVRRPRCGWSHGLFHDEVRVTVVATDTLSPARVAGFWRADAVEMSRLCAARPNLTRVALRSWRPFVFPALGYRWALSYQDRAVRGGALYRFDGGRVGRSRSGVDSTYGSDRARQGGLGPVRGGRLAAARARYVSVVRRIADRGHPPSR